MPRAYVDNAMNRSLGRVGMSVGSMPVSRGSSYSGGGGGFSSSRNDSGYSSPSSKTYVDNAMNRSIGRVGMSVGSMPVSHGSSSIGGGGSYSSSRNESGYSSSRSSSSSKTYVDNTMNRSVGRVGMPVGSMTVSRKSTSYGSESGDRKYSLNDSVFTRSSCSEETYVDNEINRSLGRVGKLKGSMPVSKKSSGGGDRSLSLNDSVFSRSSSAADTYVDNSINRSYGRIGMPRGSMPVSRDSYSGTSNDRKSSRNDSAQSKSYGLDTYVDNAYNRKHGRVGLQKRSSAESPAKTDIKGRTKDQGPATETYVDNPYNRKHHRVGLPIGSKVISKGSDADSCGYDSRISKDMSISADTKVYKDNDMNRRLGRVGKQLGSMPVGKRSSTTKQTREMIGKMEREELQELCYDSRVADYDMYEQHNDGMKNAMLQALCHYNRLFEEMAWKKKTRSEDQPKTTTQVLEEYKGKTIPFKELNFGSKIGSGGFGEVYFAKWNKSVVAVKQLKAGTVSKRRLADFVREMKLFCELDHANIVRFVGSCVERPDLCIVMEYMEMSLFDAIHYRDDTDFTEIQRLDIIRQTCNGLMYLHDEDIAHRDLKTSNVLINSEGGEIEVKITDFGLSSMKGNIESSSSCGGDIIGTPRYAAPEILRGDRGLTVTDYKKADMYSLSLVLFEVVFEDEPFYDYNLHQLIKYVGKYGVSPEVPDDPAATGRVLGVMEMAWSFKPEDRPQIADVFDVFWTLDTLYV